MTKQEYMQTLQENLERFGQELQEDILEDYRQHFAEGEKQGKSEEEIIEELGNIEEMIRELAEEGMSAESGRSRESQGIFDKLKSIMPEVKVEISKNLGGLEKNFKDLGESFSRNFEGFGKSFENFGKNFEGLEKNFENFGKNFEGMEKNFEKNIRDCTELGFVSSEDCKAVELNGEVADIIIEPSEDNLIHFLYENNRGVGRKYELYQYEQDGVFYVGMKHKDGMTDDDDKVKMKLFGQTVISYGRVSNYCGEFKLSVKVPEGFPRVDVKVSGGDVRISDVRVDELRIQSVRGDVVISETSSGHVDVNSTSGDVKISGGELKDVKCITASGDLDISKTEIGAGIFSTGSGDIFLEDTKVGSCRFGTGSGDVQVKDGYIEMLTCNTGSGDISICSGVEVYECETGSGDIGIKAKKAPEKVSLSTGSGDVDLQLGGLPGMNVTVETAIGDAQVEWKGESRKKIKRANFAYGDGSCKVRVKSGTGDISVSAD